MSKGVLFGQNGTVTQEVMLVDLAPIHPKAEALVANELHHADRFVDSRVLLLVAIQLVLVDEHPSCPPVCFLVY